MISLNQMYIATPPSQDSTVYRLRVRVPTAYGADTGLSEGIKEELDSFTKLLNLDKLSERPGECHSIEELENILKETHYCIEHYGSNLGFEEKWLLVQFLVAVELWAITEDRLKLVDSLWKDNIFAGFILTSLDDLGFSEEDS